jgi:predicted PurR-regulated permease PerM
MDFPAPDRERPSPTRDERVASASTAAVVALAVLAFGAAATIMGPVLQPFLVALFLFHATQFGAKSLARLGMQPWSAYPALIGLTLIFSILTAQFVYREADIFRTTWPRYEDRITGYISAWWPTTVAAQSPPAKTTAVESDGSPARPRVQPGTAPHAADDAQAAAVPSDDMPAADIEPLPEQTKDLLATAREAVEKPETADTGKADHTADGHADTTAAQNAAKPIRTRRAVVRPVRTTLTELFRISSQDVLDYVFSHGLHVAELFVVVFCYLVFLFLGSRKLKARVLRAFPGERGSRLVAIGEGITESMERFMVVKTAAGVGMAVSAGMIMYLFGLDHWMLWAFLFFAANYVTYIGSMAACIPPLVMAYLDLDSAAMATLLSALIVLNRVFWIDFFELRMSGKQLNLDPTLLFLWLSYWGWAWGILGLILAYPMMAALRITLEHLGGLQGWALLLSDE